MDYVKLGRTGLKVSRLCLGCMTYGSKSWRDWVLEEDESRPFIKRALEHGINFFDTANIYSLGASEEIFGRAVRDMALREELVIATKDNRFSLRVVKYTSASINGTSTLADQGTIGSVIANGLTWRNIYLYQMGGYDWASRDQPSYRNTWSNAFPVDATYVLSPNTAYTQAQADIDEDKAIDT